MPLDDKLLEILICPQCKTKVLLDEKGENLVCEKCRLSYEVRDGIPIMLISEAKPLGA